jgi:hypothetical protein
LRRLFLLGEHDSLTALPTSYSINSEEYFNRLIGVGARQYDEHRIENSNVASVYLVLTPEREYENAAQTIQVGLAYRGLFAAKGTSEPRE